jgi:16S rRNA (adenine1518-N6/adenine1519-N6)-dimethyltransferase
VPQFGKRRALGQHFLRDKNIAGKIAATAVAEARKNGCRVLLEIGPGKGAITEPLLDQLNAEDGSVKQMILAERDSELIALWEERARQGVGFPLRVEGGDFVELPEERWLTDAPIAVASNLPYSAGTAITVRLARHFDKIPVMVLMFQAEVARRLRAEQGSKEWGSLSVWIQNRWDVTKLVAVPPGAFAPPPDVDSEVVVLRRRAEPRVPVPHDAKGEELWDSLLRVSFAHRRKMLRVRAAFERPLEKGPRTLRHRPHAQGRSPELGSMVEAI